MKIINIQEAKTHLSRLTEEAASGSDIVLAKAGKPIARLVAYEKPPQARVGRQMPELVIPDDFDAEDPAVLDAFGLQ